MAHKSHPNRINAYYKKERPVRPPLESQAVPAAQLNDPHAAKSAGRARRCTRLRASADAAST
jgi:hypothetical protein